MSIVTDRLDKHCDALPGYAAWLEEQDRGFWLARVRAAALKHYATLPVCSGCGSCETCSLSEALCYTAPAGEAGPAKSAA